MPYVLNSNTPAQRWEDALISGNGSTGIMVMGKPVDETVVVNHEKLWVVNAAEKREVVNLQVELSEARKLARAEKFKEAEALLKNAFAEQNRQRYADDTLSGVRIRSDSVHPAFHLRIFTPAAGDVKHYNRAVDLGSGEIKVSRQDDNGTLQRKCFVSRAHDVAAIKIANSPGKKLNCKLRIEEAPGKKTGQLGEVNIEHHDNEMYFHAAYFNTAGRPEPEGYHSLARIICNGGCSRAEGEEISIEDADEILLLLKLEYLGRANAASKETLRKALEQLPEDYDRLLSAHVDIHGEMFDRLRLEFDDKDKKPQTPNEDLLAEAEESGPSPQVLEILHAVGRYALISSSGELPPALMGIWGDTWEPAWAGRFTFDSNLNLAVSYGSQGNLPEAMESYFGFIESLYPDWEANASTIYGFRGRLSCIAQGWRHGLAMHGWFAWTGGAGWLSHYFFNHYLHYGGKNFLRERVFPLLKNIADFYKDFLEGMENENETFLIYPSISPENTPIRVPGGEGCMVVPNATSEIAIIKQVLRNLITACGELGIERDSIPRWEKILSKLPQYRINEDGAIAEWSYPGIKDNYNHRHNSHLYGLYPALEITRENAPELYEAAKAAIEKRLEAGRGNRSAHGLLELAFFACRLRDPELLWRCFEYVVKDGYLNSSMISCHNPDRHIYNLDATLSLPAILMEMLLQSRPGRLELLPALAAEKLPAGELRGLRARTQIVVDRLKWDFTQNLISICLTSAIDQEIEILIPRPVTDIRTENETSNRPVRLQDDKYRLHLAAGELFKCDFLLQPAG